MKFRKEFEENMVPEWTEVYMDYKGLKKILREIMHQKSEQPSTPLKSSQHRFSLERSFSGLTRRPSSFSSDGDIEDQVVPAKKEEQEGPKSKHFFRPKIIKNSAEGETEIMFFKKLDDELNKVNAFYKNKVEEVMNEAESMNKQMDALVALRLKVANPDLYASSPGTCHSVDVATTPCNASNQGMRHVDGVEMRKYSELEQSPNVQSSDGEVDPVQTAESNHKKEEHLEVLECVKINYPPESPVSTIKSVFTDSKEKELRFEKAELKNAEEQLRAVFIEFYQKLRLLNEYSFMNLSAFSKIMKKYDKITSRRVSRSYMKIVDNSYIGSSDEVTSVLKKVEATFTKHFTKSDRKKAMKSLRPKAKKEKDSIIFLSGFFFGCSVVLLVAIVLRIEARKLMDRQEGASYMENIFPLYSFFAYVVLHMLIIAADIYLWKRFRVNYPFIFGFKQGTELGYQEFFLLSTGLAALSMGSFLANLHLDMGSGAQHSKTVTQLFPLGLVTVVLIIIFFPFDVLYRSSRFFFIKTMFRCLCAPLYMVRIADYFLLDQICSQVQALRSLELYVCYYGLGEYSTRQKKCHTHGVYNVFYFIVGIIPYWLRLLQCIRRFFEEKDAEHIYNGVTYVLTIISVLLRTAFELKAQMTWMVLALICSAITIIANTYLDIVYDWGLLRRHSRNFYLRDRLLVPYRGVYYAAMVLDVVLRLDWLQLVVAFNVRSLKKVAITTTLSCMEIIRRGIWNFFRLENEHLNNVGKFRAFKSVPHPFSYYRKDEDTDKDD